MTQQNKGSESPKPPGRPKSKSPKDRHASGFLVRLPEACRDALQKLKAKTRRALTVETQLALDEHLRRAGIEPPAPPDSST